MGIRSKCCPLCKGGKGRIGDRNAFAVAQVKLAVARCSSQSPGIANLRNIMETPVACQAKAWQATVYLLFCLFDMLLRTAYGQFIVIAVSIKPWDGFGSE
jgi:hypothetical protein